MLKIDVGVSWLDRLGKKVTETDKGKGGGDSEQLLTDRLKTSEQGVSTALSER